MIKSNLFVVVSITPVGTMITMNVFDVTSMTQLSLYTLHTIRLPYQVGPNPITPFFYVSPTCMWPDTPLWSSVTQLRVDCEQL